MHSTILQKIRFPTTPSSGFVTRLTSCTILKTLKVQLLRDPNERPENNWPSLQKVKQQSSMNYIINKINKMSISQIKFGYLSDSHFTFLWDADVADIWGDWCDWIWRNYLMLTFFNKEIIWCWLSLIKKLFDVDFLNKQLIWCWFSQFW